MQPAAGQDNRRERAREFFIPDLCAPSSVFVAVVLSELLLVVHVLAASPLKAFDWNLLATASLFVQWVVLLSVALLCYLRAPLSRFSMPVASLSCLLTVALVAMLSSVGMYLLFPLVMGPMEYAALLRNALVATILAGIVLRYFYLQQQLRRQEQLELQARLDSLRDRMRPHFLFNTLNGIASLIMSQPETAERAVEDLSELLRVSLQERSANTTVANELRMCELYLGIEKLRLGERLNTEFDVQPGCLDKSMPALVLQPLVENAIYHGISRLPEGGSVRVTVRCEEGVLIASVHNPLPAQAVESGGHQVALANIRARLDALYGAAGKLEVFPQVEQFHVRLSYPLETPG
ncbi:MAG: histidine kinase [Halioglobus sp.]